MYEHSFPTDLSLQSCLEYGIGLIHDGLSDEELKKVKKLYQQGFIRVLVVAQ